MKTLRKQKQHLKYTLKQTLFVCVVVKQWQSCLRDLPNHWIRSPPQGRQRTPMSGHFGNPATSILR